MKEYQYLAQESKSMILKKIENYNQIMIVLLLKIPWMIIQIFYGLKNMKKKKSFLLLEMNSNLLFLLNWLMLLAKIKGLIIF